MTPHSAPLDRATLHRMTAAGVVTDALLVAEPEDWSCVVLVRRAQYSRVAKRGGVRHWSKMERAARYLRQLGITEFRVDARNMLDTATARTDFHVELDHPHEEGVYDTWFREQVQAAIAEAGSPDAVWYAHEEVTAEMRERIEVLRANARAPHDDAIIVKRRRANSFSLGSPRGGVIIPGNLPHGLPPLELR